MATLQEYTENKKRKSAGLMAISDTKTAFRKVAEYRKYKSLKLPGGHEILKCRECFTILLPAGVMVVGTVGSLIANRLDYLLMSVALPIAAVMGLEQLYVSWYHPKVEMYDKDKKTYRSDNKTYGDAHFMTPEEEKDVLIMKRSIYNWSGFCLGTDALGYIVGKAITSDEKGRGNAHAMIIGNSGSGKDTAFVDTNVLNLIQSGSSVIVASTKDDVYSLTRFITQVNGVKNIWLLDFRSQEAMHSDGINFLSYITSPDSAQEVASALLRNTTPTDKPNADYWYRGEEAICYAILLYFTSANRRGCSFADVVDFISKGAVYIEQQMDMLPENHPARTQYEIWKGGDPKPKQQVIQGLGFRLKMFDDIHIRQLISHNDVDFEKFTKEQSIIYLLADDVSTNNRALTSMVFYTAFYQLEQIAKNNKKKNGQLDNRVGIIINEAYSIGSIPNFPNQITVARGYGIDILTIIQDIPILQQLYPDSWETILNNCGVKMLLQTDDPVTAKYFTDLAGTFTARIPTYDEKGRETGSRDAPAELLPFTDIRSLGANEGIVILSTHKSPLKINFMHYYADIPGSEFEYFNKHDKKYYHAHPLLKDEKRMSAVDYYPKWANEEADKREKMAAQSTAAAENNAADRIRDNF